MAVTETIELQDGLREALRRGLDAVIVNALLPRRFTAAELRTIAALDGRPGDEAGRGRRRARAEDRLRQAAAHAARSVHERAAFQHNQVARLRRRRFPVIGIPFLWSSPLDVSALGSIADRLARTL
jgi:hypothetical protein